MHKILAFIMAAALAVPAMADTQVDQVLKQEKRGLFGLRGAKLGNLFSPSKKKTKNAYTRGFIDGLPEAKGGEEWQCLSEALYFEARGESVKGQFAVAEVIMNRVDSPLFPNTVCGVVHQGTGRKYQCQFTYTCDGYAEVISEPRAYDRVSKIARAVLDGKVPSLTDGATYYHTTAVSPRWSRVFTRTAKIGVHLFYRDGVRTASN